MTPQNPFGRRHHRGSEHLQNCADCALSLARERRYIERLRDSEVPPASDDLTARLLARTRILAAAPPPAPAPHLAAKVLSVAAGGTAAVAGILAAGAFALAGDGLPAAGPALSGSLVRQASQLPADGRQLSGLQLSALRSEGWVCPGLEALGFHIETANAVTFNGRPAIEMHLSDGRHYATVLEQHPARTGLQEGKATVSGRQPWTATYETAAATFTVESDLPADLADDTLPVLHELSIRAAEGIHAGGSADQASLQAASPGDSPAARLERGFRKLGELLAP